MADKTFTYTIDIKSEKLDELTKLQTKINEIKAAQKQLKETNQENSAEWQRNQAELKKTQTELSAAQKEIQKVDQATKFQKGSMLELSNELSKNRAAYKALSEEERNNINIGGKLLTTIQAQDKEIKKLDGSMGLAQRNVGGYSEALAGMPGALGQAGNAVKSFSATLKALLLNPVVLVISAITGALLLLFKAFKSTDEGATAMASAFKAIGNVVDVLIDRVASFGSMLKSIFTLDWAGFKKNGSDAFGGVGKSISEAAKAGWEYEQVMDGINDREKASLTRTAQLKKEIEELTVASKDRALGSKEQIRLAELAMQKAIELNSIEAGFVKERNEAETKNLAAKIQNDKLSVESKQDMLKEWLKITDEQLSAELENNKAFAEFYNKNEKEFQKLQEQKAKEVEKETQLITETRRLQTSLFAFKEDLRKEDAAVIEKANEEALKAEKKKNDEIAKSNEKLAELIKKLNEDVTTDELEKLKIQEQNQIEAIEKEIGNEENKQEAIKLIQEKYRNERQKLADEEWEKFLEKEEIEIGRELEKKEKAITDQEELNEKLEELYNTLTGGRIGQINSQYEAEKKAIQKSLADEKSKAEAIRLLDKATAQAKVEAAKQSTTEIMGYLKEGSLAYKAFALLQVGLDTAQAIGSLTAMSEANPANAFTFGGAGILQFAAGLIRILANIGQATQIISSVKFAKGGEIVGKSHAQGGEIIEAEHGEVIINKRSATRFKDELSYINQWGGGVPIGKPISRLAANGGLVARSPGLTTQANININRLSTTEVQGIIDRTINSMIIELPISEVNKIQKRVNVIETNSSL